MLFERTRMCLLAGCLLLATACCGCDDMCEGVVCCEGEMCIDGQCVSADPCEGVVCAETETCIDGQCVSAELCGGVVCDIGQWCLNGICEPRTPGNHTRALFRHDSRYGLGND